MPFERPLLATVLVTAAGVPLASRFFLEGAPRMALVTLALMTLGAVNVLALRRAGRVIQELLATDWRLRRELAARRRGEEEAVAAMVTKTSFLAHMSHEIRTPMVGILGASELLLQTQLTARQHGLATTIETSTRSLLGILNNVLDLSRMDAGRLTVSVEPVDARLVAEDVAELLAAPAASRGIDLVVSWDAHVPSVALADPLRLRQILVNLLGNAVKFTERGHVLVRATLDPEPPDGRARLRISVEDTGGGVPEEKLATLFEPFVQADIETTRRYGGSGLGLAIAKQLVELMGGEIGARSTSGVGSTFWFTLPLRAEAAAEPALPSLDGLRVLVVSDRPHTAAVVEETLRNGQAAVLVVPSITAASDDAARAFGATVVLVDVRVPDAPALWADGRIRAELPRRTILLVAPQADALRLSGDVEATIALPLRARALWQALSTHGRSAEAPKAPQLHARVLVADDVEINREVVRQLLEQIGCTVDLAASGVEAVEQCRLHPYDLVFMDCHMPQLDGFQATQAIRGADGPNRSTPIVALTASAFSDERARCADIGMDDYLTKPIGRSELAACLVRFAGGRPAPAVTAAPAPAVRDDQPAVLDVEATLNRIGGNTQLFDRLVTIFRRQTPPLVTELHQALTDGDAASVRATAHKLNGSLRSLGGWRAQAAAAALEQQAAGGTLEGAHALYDTLARELAHLDDAIGGYLARGQQRDGA